MAKQRLGRTQLLYETARCSGRVGDGALALPNWLGGGRLVADIEDAVQVSAIGNQHVQNSSVRHLTHVRAKPDAVQERS